MNPMFSMQIVQERAPTARVHSDARTLGLAGLLCSPALLVASLLGGFDNPTPPQSVVLAQFIFLVGWICSTVGLLRLHAAGQGYARYLLWLQLGGVVIASTQELQDLVFAAPDRSGALYRAADAAWPLSVMFMIVVGIAVARAGVLRGWRRFTPVFCGAPLPLSIIIAAVAGRTAMGLVFGVMTTLAWGALGSALITSDGAPAHVPDAETAISRSSEADDRQLATP
jgi:hypothetical protein